VWRRKKRLRWGSAFNSNLLLNRAVLIFTLANTKFHFAVEWAFLNDPNEFKNETWYKGRGKKRPLSYS
jgi:hypothetical protein